MTSWPEFETLARPFEDARVLTNADVLTVLLVATRFEITDPLVALGLAFAVRAPRVGDPSVELTTIAKRVEAERDQQRSLAKADTDAQAQAPDSDDMISVTPLATLTATVTPPPAELVLDWPEAGAWQEKVLACATAVGGPDARHLPFVRQDVVRVDRHGAELRRTLLFTRRMYREQERVAEALRARAVSELPEDALPRGLDGDLLRHFPDSPDDPQRGAKAEARRAAKTAATRPLALVVGGPGTGKTFSVTRLLATLLATSRGGSERDGGSELAIVLAAPTGKATARMREAIREATDERARPPLDVPDEIRERLRSLPAETLHKLVGLRPDGSCRHHRDRPLAADVVVVDEASMVDLGLMRRLCDAVRPSARLILLGDRDQLASVDAGCVLADLYDAREHALEGLVTTFTHSQRFAGAPDVGLVAAGLQSYRTAHPDLVALERPEERRALAVQVMCDERHATAESVGRDADGTFPSERAYRRIAHLGEPQRSPRGYARPTDEQLVALARPYLEGFTMFGARPDEPNDSATPETEPAKATTPVDDDTARAQAHSVLGYAELLRRLRKGRSWAPELFTDPVRLGIFAAFERYRVLATHREGPLGVAGLERALAERVRTYIHGDKGSSSRYWVGRPVLVTENAYDVRLMNGDVGLILPVRDASGVSLAAVFPSEAGLRAVATSRLPPHEGALAMTIHKSQGSQFERVALVLAGRPSLIQTRELVYTGVTRAKNQLGWLGSRSELEDALDRTVARTSGLAALLSSSVPTKEE